MCHAKNLYKNIKNNVLSINKEFQIFFVAKHFAGIFLLKLSCSGVFEFVPISCQPSYLEWRKFRARKCSTSHTKSCPTFIGKSHAHKMQCKDHAHLMSC